MEEGARPSVFYVRDFSCVRNGLLEGGGDVTFILMREVTHFD